MTFKSKKFNASKNLLIIFTCLISAPYSFAESVDDENLPEKSNYTEQQGQAIEQLKIEVAELKKQLDYQTATEDSEEEQPSALQLGGFFDINAQASTENGQPFSLGGLELGIQYDQIENLAVSAALVWSEDSAEVAVAVLDYHANSHNVPTRGRLFGEPGYHLQLGRFDIPFGIDYEYFAAADRPNISGPMTTERVQNDGFNGDGVRAYGTWTQFDYAVYWTNSLFEDSGTSIGGRLGYFPGRDPYQIHNKESQSNFLVGVSWLQDMDENDNKRKTLYAMDVSFNYSIASFIVEYMSSDSDDLIFLDSGVFAGENDEKGYNARVLFDLDYTTLFFSYGEWSPEYSHVIDEEEPVLNYSVEDLKRAIVGINYSFDDYLQIKIEYLTHLNTLTEEPGFEKDKLTFQMVASF